MPPPAASAEQLASRLFLGPALRAQPDRRLVTLVRDGYEAAFEEIVRRYRKPLDRFAATIVGGHSEDVTQDAFSKALLALRGSETEIELRPWLYRIVRNTALNDLRDSPPVAAELSEGMTDGRSAAEEAERREEIGELTERLRALPDPQRAAIVMRELEGLSHEEIAAALGVSGGAARQAIYRGRQALRDGFGLLLPLPLLRLLAEHGAETAAGAGGAVAAGTSLGAGGALKVGLATVLVAGSVGAGVAVEQHQRHGGEGTAAATADLGRGEPGGDSEGPGSVNPDPDLPGLSAPGDDEDRRGDGGGPGRHGNDEDRSGHRGDSEGPGGDGDFESIDPSGGPGPDGAGPGHGGRGSDSGRGGRGSGEDLGHGGPVRRTVPAATRTVVDRGPAGGPRAAGTTQVTAEAAMTSRAAAGIPAAAAPRAAAPAPEKPEAPAATGTAGTAAKAALGPPATRRRKLLPRPRKPNRAAPVAAARTVRDLRAALGL